MSETSEDGQTIVVLTGRAGSKSISTLLKLHPVSQRIDIRGFAGKPVRRDTMDPTSR